MLSSAPATAPDTHTRAHGDVPGTSWGLLGTLWGLMVGTVVWTVRGLCWVGPPLGRLVVSAAVRAWPYLLEVTVLASTVVVQVAAGRAWDSNVTIPWPTWGRVGGGIGAGFRGESITIGVWLWPALGLVLVASILAALGAVQVPTVRGHRLHERHYLTLALIVSLAEFGALSTLAGWRPWSLIVGPVAAIWWAFFSPTDDTSKLRARLHKRHRVRWWGRRVWRASEGHLSVVDVIESEHLALVKCTLKNEATQSGIERNAPDLAAGLGKGEAQLRVECSVEASAVTLRIKSGDPLAESADSTVLAGTAPVDAPIRIGRDSLGQPAFIEPLKGNVACFGENGSGKTTAFKIVMVGAVQRGWDVRFIDLKYGITAASMGSRWGGVAADQGAAVKLIAEVRAEMDRRGAAVARQAAAGGADVFDGQPILLAIDEAHMLKDPQAWVDLVEIATLGRAERVRILLSTQQPSAIPAEVVREIAYKHLGPLSQGQAQVALSGREYDLSPKRLGRTPGRAILVHSDGTEIQTDWLRPEAVAAWAAAVPQDVAEATVRRLPEVQAAVLDHVLTSPNCTAKEIGKALGRDQSSITKRLNELAKKGLVESNTNTKPATWRATNKETP